MKKIDIGDVCYYTIAIILFGMFVWMMASGFYYCSI